MKPKVHLRPVREGDMPVVHGWWDDPENYGATGLEHGISPEAAMLKFHERPSADPYEEWFAICLEGCEQPLGLVIVAPCYPQPELLSIGSILVDKAHRRQGLGRRAVEQLEAWLKARYPGLTAAAGVFEYNLPAARFWEACGYTLTGTVETSYTYQGRKLRSLRYRKQL